MKNLLISIAIIIVCVSAINNAQCGFFGSVKPHGGPDKDIQTLMITGNYAKSRLLADLIQSEIKQPYILIPQNPSDKIYFVPASGDGIVLDQAKYTKFVKFLNPKQILIFGDPSYVPESYLTKIDKTQTYIRISNKSWDDIATAAGNILDLPRLAKDYKRLCAELESGKLYTGKEGSKAPSPLSMPVEETTEIEEITTTPIQPLAPPEPVVLKDNQPPPVK